MGELSYWDWKGFPCFHEIKGVARSASTRRSRIIVACASIHPRMIVIADDRRLRGPVGKPSYVRIVGSPSSIALVVYSNHSFEE
jgi:hypothetical protein